jgi:glutaredoxin
MIFSKGLIHIKKYLKKKGVNFDLYEIDTFSDGVEELQVLNDITGKSNVPIIFIGG